MTTDRAVMQGALDALTGPGCECFAGYERCANWISTDSAIAALRQALAQPVPDVAAVMELIESYATVYMVNGPVDVSLAVVEAAITALVQDRDEWAESTRDANTRFQQAER